MKKLLIVNTLPEDDPAVFPALEALGSGAEEVQVIHAYEKNLRPCIGCNARWLVTPGICAVKDGYEELLKAYLSYDATVFLSGTALNFVDYRMKNVIDRTLPLVTMYTHVVDGQFRHVPRYDKKPRFGDCTNRVCCEEFRRLWRRKICRKRTCVSKRSLRNWYIKMS